jgi:type I restriction enzyme, S subunit
MIPKDWQRKSLSAVAIIQTGIAKGATNVKDPLELPYLRVANVQDGYLDLSVIKTITIDKSKAKVSTAKGRCLAD